MKIFAFMTMLMISLTSCRTRQNATEPNPPKPQSISSEISQPEGLQEIALRLAVEDQYTVQYKFCQPSENCTVFEGHAKTTESLVLQAPSIYSARLCEKSTQRCKEWQVLLLHPINDLKLSTNTPQVSSTLAFAQGSLNGIAFSSLGASNFIIAEYMYMENLHTQDSSNGLQLFATGLPNLGNTCFLNSTLQMIRRSPEMVKAAQQLSRSQDDFLKDFGAKLTTVLKGMATNKIDNNMILELMSSYDRYQNFHRTGNEKFGKFEENNWRFIGQQRSANDFLNVFRTMLNTNIDVRTIGYDPVTKTGRKIQHVDVSSLPAISLDTSDQYTSLQKLVDSRFVNADTSRATRATEGKTYVTDRIVASPTEGIAEISFSVRRLNASWNKEKSILEKIKNTSTLSIENDLSLKVPFANLRLDKNPDEQMKTLYEQPMQLRSAIVHRGTADGGHYISYVFKGDEIYYCSDATITKVPENERLQVLTEISTNATNLHYVRVPHSQATRRENIEIKTESFESEFKPVVLTDGRSRSTKKPILEPSKKPFLDTPIEQKFTRNYAAGYALGFLGFQISALVLTPIIVQEAMHISEMESK